MAYPQIEIAELKAPLEDTDLLALLWHKGSLWIDDLKRRVEGKRAGSLDRFFLARAGKKPIANVWYTVSAADNRLGLLGHVYTRPDYRRRGISERLMEAAMEDFTRRRGLVMQLYTSNPVTVPFYEKLGYEEVYANQAIHETDWYMRYPVGAQPLIGDWFSPSACTIRKITEADLPKYCLLYNTEYHTKLKDRAQGIGLGLECELTFITTVERTTRGEGVCCVLENGQTIVGIGSLMKNGFAHQSHIGAIDYYVHPNFRAEAKDLIDACLSRRDELGVEIVYAMCVDEDKKQVFASLGFAEKALLRNHYKIKDQHFDCVLCQVDSKTRD